MNPDDNKPEVENPNQPTTNEQAVHTGVQQPGMTVVPEVANNPTESAPVIPEPSHEQLAPAVAQKPIQPTSTPEPVPTVGQVPPRPMFAADPAPVLPPAQKSKKKLYIITGTAAFLLLAGLAFLFLWFLPNRPDAVFSSSLDRSGKAIESLVEEATATDNLKKMEKSEMTGSFELEASGQKFNGDLNFKYDTEKVNGMVTFKAPESVDVKAEFMAKAVENSTYPDMFFKIEGIEEVVGSMLPQIAKYDNQWISVESAYLENASSSLGYVAGSLASTKDEPTAEETAALIQKVSDTTNEYVFTSDSSKNVLEKREFIGKETTEEGVKAYHYKVAINKEHAADYCKALLNTLYDDAAFKKITGDSFTNDDKKDAANSCDGIKNEKELDKTFDMWMDAKYKIIHKMRFAEDNSQAYVDVGQIYKGGDKLQLFVAYKDEEQKADGKLTVDVDTKQLTTEANLLVEYKGDEGFKLTGKIGVKPYSGEVKFEEPGNVTPIQTILNELGIGSTPTGIDGIYGVEPEETL